MTDRLRGLRRRRWWLWAVGFILGGFVLSSCSGITTVIDTERALQNAGFGSVSVSPKPTSNGLSVSVSVSGTPAESDAVRVASVVWQNFHERFDVLGVTVHGSGATVRQEFTFAQMSEQFGARNPDWNASSVASGTRNVGLLVLAVVGGAIVVVVVIIVAVQRANRRRRPPWGGGGPWPGAGPGSGGAQWPGGYRPPGPYPPSGPAGSPPGPYPPSSPYPPPPPVDPPRPWG